MLNSKVYTKKVRDLRKRIQINISQSTYLWEGLQK